MTGAPKKRNPPPVSVRLTAEERERLEQAAEGTSLSGHIRSCLFGDDVTVRKTRRRTPTVDEVALAQILGLLGRSRIANNLNQLAREANRGTLRLTPDTQAQVEEAHRHVKQIRQVIIAALGLSEGAEP